MNLIEKDTNIVGSGKGIVYVDGKYYLVSQSPAKICYSEDLEKWVEVSLNDTYLKPTTIAYGNGLYVITGNAGIKSDTYIYYSKDGKTWTPKTLDTGVNISLNINSCKFINNRFVFSTGYYHQEKNLYVSTKSFYETSDCKNIKRYDFLTTGKSIYSFMDIAYSNGLYCWVGEHGAIFTSNSLKNWVKQKSGVSDKLVGISYGKGSFVVVGDNGTILTSSDGKTWTKQNSSTNSYLIRSCYSNGMFIAVGYNGVILQSTDCINWLNISKKTAGLRYGLTVNDDRFVITGTKYAETGTIPIFYFDVTRSISASDDSSLFFYNTNLDLIGIADTFISLRWQRKFFEAGEFEIVLPNTDYIRKIINTNILVLRNNYTEAGVIETIEYDENNDEEEIIISGRFLSSIFERRIVKNKINFSGNSIEGMNTIVRSITPFTNKWEIKEVSSSSKSISFQCTYKNVYEYLCKISEYSGVAFRLVPNIDSKVYMFEVYQGKDRTNEQMVNEQYSFSDDMYNIEQGKLVVSLKNKVNYVLVGGVGEDENRILVEVNKKQTGFDLFEVFSDQKSLSNENLSTTEYKEKLNLIGEGKINEETFNLEVTALSNADYKKKWDLGDIVNIKNDKWNITTAKRIIEVEEVIEDGKKTILPTFGEPFTSAWENEE